MTEIPHPHNKTLVKPAADSGAAVGGVGETVIVCPLFSLQAEGAKKRSLAKKKRRKEISPSADGDGSSALDSQTFGKV